MIKKLTPLPVLYPPPVPLTKANVLAFADKIYHEKDGIITMTKLCEGGLTGDKSGKRLVHCAIGEAYHHFVSSDPKSMRKLQRAEDNGYRSPHIHEASTPHQEDNDECNCDGCYTNGDEYSDINHEPTMMAVDALTDLADLKKKNKDNCKDFALFLHSIVEDNDGTNDTCYRSSEVAEKFRRLAKKFLK